MDLDARAVWRATIERGGGRALAAFAFDELDGDAVAGGARDADLPIVLRAVVSELGGDAEDAGDAVGGSAGAGVGVGVGDARGIVPDAHTKRRKV